MDKDLQRKLAEDLRTMRTAALAYKAERDLALLLLGDRCDAGHAGGPRAFVDLALATLWEHPSVEHLTILLFDRESHGWTLWEQRRRNTLDVDGGDPPYSRAIVDRVMASGRAWYVNDAQEEEPLREMDSVRRLRLRTVHASPLRVSTAERPYGVLYLENRKEANAFDLRWIRCVEQLARRLGPVVDVVVHPGVVRGVVRGVDPGVGPGVHPVVHPGVDPGVDASLDMDSRTAEFRRGGRFAGVLGDGEAMAKVLARCSRFLDADDGRPMLIRGQAGTGKTLLATSLHRDGPRREGPLLEAKLALLSGNADRTAMVRGLFGDPEGGDIGLAARAHGGTLVIEQLELLDRWSQEALLALVDDRMILGPGGDARRVDVQLIGTTDVDLTGSVPRPHRSFRRDLLHRFHHEVELPPLADRGEDLGRLAEALASRVAAERGVPRPLLGPDLLIELRRRPWTGNLHELHQVVAELVDRFSGEVVTGGDLERVVGKGKGTAADRSGSTGEPLTIARPYELRELQKLSIARALRRYHDRNIKYIASELGIAKSTLYRKCSEYGIDIQRERARGRREAPPEGGGRI